jgi:hypothetical protein
MHKLVVVPLVLVVMIANKDPSFYNRTSLKKRSEELKS